MSILDDRHVLFTDMGTDGQSDHNSVPLSVERVRDVGGDQIHIVVGDVRTVFGSDDFLEILRKLHWAVAIDRGLVRPKA